MFKKAIVLVLLITSGSAYGAVLDFEEFNPPIRSVLQFPSGFTSMGFAFTPLPASFPQNTNVLIADNDQPNVPNTGNNTLVATADSEGFIITESGGGAFDLGSFLAAEGRNTTTNFFRFSARSILLEGTQSNGATVSQELVLDLVATESIGDFELFSPTIFTDLVALTMTGLGGTDGNSFAIDNLNLTAVVSPIPLPAAVWLFGSALLGLVGFSRRKKQLNL